MYSRNGCVEGQSHQLRVDPAWREVRRVGVKKTLPCHAIRVLPTLIGLPFNVCKDFNYLSRLPSIQLPSVSAYHRIGVHCSLAVIPNLPRRRAPQNQLPGRSDDLPKQLTMDVIENPPLKPARANGGGGMKRTSKTDPQVSRSQGPPRSRRPHHIRVTPPPKKRPHDARTNPERARSARQPGTSIKMWHQDTMEWVANDKGWRRTKGADRAERETETGTVTSAEEQRRTGRDQRVPAEERRAP